MSTLYYGMADAGGGGVLLTRLEMISYERTPMYNGPDYLCTVHRLKVRGIYNPEVNAYDFPNGDIPGAALPAAALRPTSVIATGLGNTRDSPLAGILALKGNPAGATSAVPPAQSRGSMAPTTDRAIRHFMMQPRRRLIYAVGPSPLLVSPGINADGTASDRDTYNGPMPLACDVVCISGTKSFQVDYAIETYVNEALFYRNPNSVILSHRWKRHESIDQDMYSTIVTEGAAVFRTDRLAFLGRVADDFRSALFHPVNPGFVRRGWDIEVSEDNSQLRYILVDKHTHLRVVAPGVTRIEAFATAEVQGDNPMAAMAGLFGGMGKLGAISAKKNAKGSDWILSGIPLVGDLIGNLIPLLTIHFVVRVWGNDRSTRKSLEKTAYNIMGFRMKYAHDQLGAKETNLAGSTMSVTHDLNGSFVELVSSTATVAPPLAMTLGKQFGFAKDLHWPNPMIFFPDDDPANPRIVNGRIIPSDATEGYLEYDVQQQNDLYQASFLTGKDPVSGNRTGTRGGLVRSLAAAALLGQDATPANPVAMMDSAINASPP